MATKNVRWKCEICDSGLLAPSRPRLNDVRRYCLPCSADTGKLVHRVAPSLEKKRAVKKVVATKRTTSKRATVAKNKAKVQHKKKAIGKVQTFGRQGFHIEKEAKKIWKLLEPYHNGKAFPKITMQQRGYTVRKDGGVSYSVGSYAGLAYIHENRIWLSANPEWGTVAHELVHLAVGVRRGVQNSKAHDKVFYDCLRDVTQRRFKIVISFHEVTRYGYAVDWNMRRQLVEKNVYTIFAKKEDQ